VAGDIRILVFYHIGPADIPCFEYSAILKLPWGIGL